MAKKSIVQGLKLSRSGKYTFQFIEGMEERWQLSMKQAEIDLKLDVMGYEAKQKLYKQSLDTIDAEMKELRRTRENILDGNSTKKTAANKAAASAKQSAAQFNARANDTAEAFELRNKQSARNTTTTAINQQRAREAAGKGGGTGGRAGTSSAASKVVPLNTREAIVSENERSGDTIGTSLMVLGDGFPDYQQPTTTAEQVGAEAVSFGSVLEGIQTDGRARGENISLADAQGIAKTQYVLQNKEADYNRLAQSYATLSDPATSGTGGTYEPYTVKKSSSVGGYKPSTVKAYTYSADMRDEASTNQDLLALQEQRNALVAPTAPVFDLIGQSRNTYRNKFGTDGTYGGSLPAQQISRLGELYTPEQIQAALTQAGVDTTQVAAPVAPAPVAAPVAAPVPVPVVPAEVPAEVVEPVTPPENPVLTGKQEEVSGFTEYMAAAGEKLKGLFTRKNDSRRQKRERSTKKAAALVQFQVAKPNSPRGKAYAIYTAGKANGDGIVKMLRLVDKAYPDLPATAIDDEARLGGFYGGLVKDASRRLTGEYDMRHNPWAGGPAHDAKMAMVELYLLGKD